MKRRAFLLTPALAAQTLPKSMQLVAGLDRDVTRPWIGPSFFANRWVDWRLDQGRIECLAGGINDHVRTVALLTRDIEDTRKEVLISAKLGVLNDAKGFGGFLIGAGAGELDYRAAALVQRSSGIGGGILCVMESDGTLVFRDHTSEQAPLRFDPLPGQSTGKADARNAELLLRITPQSDGRMMLRMTAGEASATLMDVDPRLVLGGISLVSSGARFWFRDVRTHGAANHPDRAFGPILGTMFSVNGRVLRMTVQFPPIGETAVPVVLRVRRRNGWPSVAQTRIGPGFAANFRVPDWDTSRDLQYQVEFSGHTYQGIVPREPDASRPLRIGFVNCVMPVWRTMDSGVFQPELPGEDRLPRYTKKNFYFPHSELIANVRAQKPDLLAFLGDQIYEGNPTRKDQAHDPSMDYLYKWIFWLWAFRDLTRDTPCVAMADDHDVFQGNVWGQGGRAAPNAEQEAGGYVHAPQFVNIVQATQCSHNPDPYDAVPIEQSIGVYYCAFRYGGVEFAMVEDRKFKTGPRSKDHKEAQLLGERQERFLAAWAEKVKNSGARICFSQTAWACVQTTPEGGPRTDSDSNGTPKPKRDLALRLIRDAGALMVSGDQHLASVVTHGINRFDDGPVQFTGPGGGTSFQRWFEPAAALANARGKHTGDFTDGFGNRFRVLAIANPKVTFADYRKHKKGRGQGLGDRKLKSEGFGMVIVDHAKKQYRLECWQWDRAEQFEGWPLVIGFDGKVSE
ncbi:MAG: alkaline phosphatase D family protein [Bryobacterales bacterium]|nr:alkaline phosphatase D family protein [Bryobacterales bacterium]